jgi:membrane protease YdiL (CAAX protease family)
MSRTRSLTIYLAVTFGFSWFLGAALFMLGPHAHVAVRTPLLLLYMWGPALGAVVAQRAVGEPSLTPLGVGFAANRWWIVAWLLPFALQPLTIGLSLLIPGITFSPDMASYLDRLAAALPPGKIEEVRKKMEAVPHLFFWAMMLVQPLFAGISINALAAFGEELGWRGFLFRHFADLGFWRRSAVVGFVWGVWHAPLVLQGHNYPQHPVAGAFAMIAFCMLAAPLFDRVRLRGRSVWASSILHGSVNATAGLAIVFVRGGDDLTIGMSGLPGLLALVLVDGALCLTDRIRGRALTRDSSSAESTGN